MILKYYKKCGGREYHIVCGAWDNIMKGKQHSYVLGKLKKLKYFHLIK